MSIANKTVSFPCIELRDHTRLHVPLTEYAKTSGFSRGLENQQAKSS